MSHSGQQTSTLNALGISLSDMASQAWDEPDNLKHFGLYFFSPGRNGECPTSVDTQL